MSKRKLSTRKLVMVSLFIAMQIVLERFVPLVNLNVVRVSFTFVPVAMCSIIFGPLVGGLSAFLADFLGMLIAPGGTGVYHLGFGLTTFLGGVTYGLIGKKFGVKPLSILAAVIICQLGLGLIINTYWLKALLNQGYLALLPGRALKSVIMVPIQTLMIVSVWKYIGKRLNESYLEEN